jgi:ABC-2 type transport system ATP-binding protein
MNAIETIGLTKRFRRLRTYADLVAYRWRQTSHLAVDNLSLEVKRGELFGVLGENGAGKTTIIRMLSTTLLPTSGTARVDGFDVVRQSREVRELIGLVSAEDRSFYFRLTGRQNLEFFAALYHLSRTVARRRIDALLEIFGVVEQADQPFQTYSTGTRHKFAIARGLLTEPQVLFLDEPTRSLDPIAAAEVRLLVTDYIVGDLGRTVLLATHSLAEAEAICHRIAIIRAGSLVASGTLADLRRRMDLSTLCEVQVTGPIDGLLGRLSHLPGVHDVEVATAAMTSTFSMRLQRDRGLLDEVLRTVLASGVRVEACSTREPALEEVYRLAHRPLDARRAGQGQPS